MRIYMCVLHVIYTGNISTSIRIAYIAYVCNYARRFKTCIHKIYFFIMRRGGSHRLCIGGGRK